MTAHGTFVINGVERVIVPQLARSYGVFFTAEEVKGKRYFGAKIIPARGAWIEIEAEADGDISVRIDRKRKFPRYSLLRVFGAHFDADIEEALYDLRVGKKCIEAGAREGSGQERSRKRMSRSTSACATATSRPSRTHASTSTLFSAQSATTSRASAASASTSASISRSTRRRSRKEHSRLDDLVARLQRTCSNLRTTRTRSRTTSTTSASAACAMSARCSSSACASA